MENEGMMSPTKREEAPVEIDFNEAINKIVEGKKVTKLEWNNEDYCFMQGEVLHISRNGTVHKWIISEADIVGDDWIVRSNI